MVGYSTNTQHNIIHVCTAINQAMRQISSVLYLVFGIDVPKSKLFVKDQKVSSEQTEQMNMSMKRGSICVTVLPRLYG